jgi:hypothetical protein
MATSLVSTGVQFPDSTIQTTAAATALGATTQYSIVGATTYNPYFATTTTPTNMAAGLAGTNFLGFYDAGTSTNQRSVGTPKWSSYYQLWYTMMYANSSSTAGIWMSKDGLQWYCIVPDMSASTGINNVSYVPTTVNWNNGLVIDDSNGRIFFFYRQNSNFTLRYAYTNLTGAANTNIAQTTAWTLVNTTGYCEVFFGAQYVKQSSTATSGIVAMCGGSTDGLFRVYTVSAGATAYALTFTGNTYAYNAPCRWTWEENGKIWGTREGTGGSIYNSGGSILTGWSELSTSFAITTNTGCTVGNGYLVFINGNNIYYSTGGAFNGVTVGSGLKNVIYNGSVFIAYSDSTTGGVWASTNNTPLSWTLYGAGTNGPRSFLNQYDYFNIGQRKTAT